jgi:hypothetical protein
MARRMRAEPAAASRDEASLPPKLQSGVESLSGIAMDGVEVHYDSPRPAEIGALAYTQDSEIHVAPGQEQSLPHEAWHVVQQAQGRVAPTTRLEDGTHVNDDAGLEREADAMATRSLEKGASNDESRVASELRALAPRRSGVAQRLNGASPQNFRVTTTATDDAECSVTTDLAWDSSNGNPADLSDFQSREHITFNHNPQIDMPCYNGPLPFGMALAGTVMTKPVGVMSNPGGVDKHSGAGLGPKFTMGGVANLTRGPWTLVGTQWYQTKQNTAAVWTNALGPFVITRTMAQVGDDYTLTISKVGPNCMLAAGPTRITTETSTAIQLAGAARGDQTADWNAARNQLLNANPAGNKPALQTNAIATDVRNNANGVPVTVDYEYTSPAVGGHPFAASYTIPQAWRNTIYQQARSAVRGIIDNVLTGAAPPNQFIITIFRCAGVQQQALKTNENGGTFRILLRADKLMDMGQWGGDVNTSMAGRESQRGFTDQGKKERFTKSVTTHEMGHMLHAHSDLNMFLMATMMPAGIPLIPALDPLRDEKIHICNVNGAVIQALNAKNYKQKWTYAMGNPGEVVPEVFTAIQRGRNVPKGLAAVYVAYRGMRGGNIDAALQQSFGGPIPVINEPEDCIPIINAA